jgi:tetratricopeptide (TPR) repeat protein
MNRDLAVLITLGKQAYAEKDFRRAESLLREAMAGGANFPDIHYTLGIIYHHGGKLEEASREFERSIAQNPEYTEALMSLSITLNELGRYEEAKAAYRKAAESLTRQEKMEQGNQLAGKIANIHAELGQLYLAIGKHEEAIAEYRNALLVAPGFPDLRVRLAIALKEAGNYEEGLAELDKALSDHPGMVRALVQRGIILYLKGKKKEAREAWETALYKDPLNKLIQLYMNTLDREIGAG